MNHNGASEILFEMVQSSRTFRVAGQRSRELSLIGTKLGFLQHLRRSDARLGELGRGLCVSAPVPTRTVEALEADGMVERRTDPQAARAFLISITDRGRVKLDESASHAYANSPTHWLTVRQPTPGERYASSRDCTGTSSRFSKHLLRLSRCEQALRPQPKTEASTTDDKHHVHR